MLEKELAFYEQVKGELLQHHEGKFALICGEEVSSIWDSQETAYLKGVGRFGSGPFLIKHIVQEEPVEEIPLLFHVVV